MSVISIRPSSESLRRLNSPQTPDRMPRFLPPSQMVADKSIVPNAIGDMAKTVQHSGAQVMSAVLHYKAIKQDEQDRLDYARAGADFQERMRNGFMNGDNGLLTRTGSQIEGLEADTQKFIKDTFRAVCDEHELTGRRREIFRLHTNPVVQSWQGHMAGHLLKETSQLKCQTATANREASYDTWLNSRFDPGMTKKLLDDYENERKQYGDSGEILKNNMQKFTQGIATDIILAAIDSATTESEFDDRIKQLKEDPESFYRGNEFIIQELNGRKLPADTIRKLVDKARIKKDQAVTLQQRAMNEQVESLIARAGEAEAKGIVTEMDAAIEQLRTTGETLPENSRIRAHAFQSAQKIDKAADALAAQQMLDGYLARLKDDDTARIFIPEERDKDGKVVKPAQYAYAEGTREYKLCEQVQTLVDGQLAPVREAKRKANVSLWRFNMLAGAATPGKYRTGLINAAMNGDLTLDEYRKIRADFDAAWSKGYEAGQASPRQLAAATMLKAIQDDFPELQDADFAYNAKTGKMELAKGSTFERLEYERKPLPEETVKKGNNVFAFFNPVSATIHDDWLNDTRTDQMDADLLLDLVNAATELAFYDGEHLTFDPITGSTSEDFFGNPINSKEPFKADVYFRQYVKLLKNKQATLAAADYVQNFVHAKEQTESHFRIADQRTDEALKNSAAAKPRTKVIKYAKPGAGTATVK